MFSHFPQFTFAIMVPHVRKWDNQIDVKLFFFYPLQYEVKNSWDRFNTIFPLCLWCHLSGIRVTNFFFNLFLKQIIWISFCHCQIYTGMDPDMNLLFLNRLGPCTIAIFKFKKSILAYFLCYNYCEVVIMKLQI